MSDLREMVDLLASKAAWMLDNGATGAESVDLCQGVIALRAALSAPEQETEPDRSTSHVWKDMGGGPSTFTCINCGAMRDSAGSVCFARPTPAVSEETEPVAWVRTADLEKLARDPRALRGWIQAFDSPDESSPVPLYLRPTPAVNAEMVERVATWLVSRYPAGGYPEIAARALLHDCGLSTPALPSAEALLRAMQRVWRLYPNLYTKADAQRILDVLAEEGEP